MCILPYFLLEDLAFLASEKKPEEEKETVEEKIERHKLEAKSIDWEVGC